MLSTCVAFLFPFGMGRRACGQRLGNDHASVSWRNIAIALIDPIPPSLQPETVTADGTDTQLNGVISPVFGACPKGNCTRLVPKVTVQLLHSCVFQTCNGIRSPRSNHVDDHLCLPC